MTDVLLIFTVEHPHRWFSVIFLSFNATLFRDGLSPFAVLRLRLNPFKRLCAHSGWLLRLLSSERATLPRTKNNTRFSPKCLLQLKGSRPWAALCSRCLSPNQFLCVTWPTLSLYLAGQNSQSNVNGITRTHTQKKKSNEAMLVMNPHHHAQACQEITQLVLWSWLIGKRRCCIFLLRFQLSVTSYVRSHIKRIEPSRVFSFHMHGSCSTSSKSLIEMQLSHIFILFA